MQQIEHIGQATHALASFVSSLCSADELSSTHMLDELRKGVYDTVLFRGEQLCEPRVSVSTAYPWTEEMDVSCAKNEVPRSEMVCTAASLRGRLD